MDGATARALVASASIGTLATIDAATGHPYASLVQIAPTARGEVILLISALARHTRNVAADARASVLVDERMGGGDGDPLTRGRVTLIGTMARTISPAAMRRFVEVHPSAEQYASFGDFGTWQLNVSMAHYIGGFGRIRELSATEYLAPQV